MVELDKIGGSGWSFTAPADDPDRLAVLQFTRDRKSVV